MGKISYIDTGSNILFTDIKAPVVSLEATISRNGYLSESGRPITHNYNGKIQEPTRFINAIDIDWGGAYLESLDTYINTTGDLLHQIELIYNQSKDIDLTGYLTKEEAVELYAKKTDIPKRITDLIGSDNYATISWVQEYVPRYAKSAYEVYVDSQTEQGLPYLSREEWLESLKGKNGNDGYSAYQIAQRYGYIGTENEWLASLKGKDGNDGDNGKSAYELALDNGYTGTEQEWLASLKGATGNTGPKGDTGASVNLLGYYDTLEELKEATVDTINAIGDAYNIAGTFYVYNDQYTSIDDKWKPAGRYQGDNGKNAYEIALDNGYTGTEQEWLASLKGATGNTGMSAYEIAKSFNPSIGTEEEWLASLKGEQGPQGPQGKSAYDVYVDIQTAMGKDPLSQEEWLNSLGKTYTAGNRISISEDNVISVIDRESIDMWGIK